MIAHAFYKATLFLGAGTVIHGNHDNQDIRTMGGLRRFMPVTALGFTIAILAIAGVPPLAGFLAKDEPSADAFFGHDYVVCDRRLVRRAPHRALHDPRDAARLLRQRAVPRRRSTRTRSPRRRRRRRRRRAAMAEPRGADDAPRAVISPHLADRRLRHAAGSAGMPSEPHEMPWTMVRARRSCSRSSRSSVGLLDLPFTKLEFLHRLARPGVRGGRRSPSPTQLLSRVRRSTSSR